MKSSSPYRSVAATPFLPFRKERESGEGGHQKDQARNSHANPAAPARKKWWLEGIVHAAGAIGSARNGGWRGSSTRR
jgi:hypothetical protein